MLSSRQVREGVEGDFPEVAFGVGEVAGVAAPEDVLRCLHGGRARGERLGEGGVDGVFAEALAAGATALKRPQDVFWGGYSGYFADPEGNLWEVAFNPFTDLT